MKIGIVTQPLSDNYGGILQNYALQTVLHQLGHEPITLNVIPHLLPPKIWLIHTIKYILTLPLPNHKEKYYHLYYHRDSLMAKFVKNNINTTVMKRDYSKFDIDRMGLDAIVVGSDQVWRRQYNWNVWRDKFLSFAEKKNIVKIAYGASWGTDKCEFSQTELQECRRLISKFKAVSVREQSGICLCKDLLGIDAIEVLDPTLLINKEHYHKLTNIISLPSEPYLAAYVLDKEKWKDAFITKIADRHNLKIVDFGLGNGDVSVEQWLAYFANATFVVTDSFHGSIFSIINHKPFLTITNTNRGASRFDNLLNKFGLQNRAICSENQSITQPEIDWDKVEKIKSEWQEKSINFLKDNLSNA